MCQVCRDTQADSGNVAAIFRLLCVPLSVFLAYEVYRDPCLGTFRRHDTHRVLHERLRVEAWTKAEFVRRLSTRAMPFEDRGRSDFDGSTRLLWGGERNRMIDGETGSWKRVSHPPALVRWILRKPMALCS